MEAEEAAGGGVGEVGEEEEEEGEEEGDWGDFIEGEIGAGTTLSPLRGHSSSSSDEDEAIPRSSRRSERVRSLLLSRLLKTAEIWRFSRQNKRHRSSRRSKRRRCEMIRS